MPTQKALKEQKKQKSRLEILKSWMSSFVVTIGVVIAAVVWIPKSPEAKIISLQAFEREIVYQVEVTDADHALDLSSLKAVLSNQFGSFEISLSLGMNVGIFESLMPDTDYVMKVYGSKGFGLENLASMSVRTSGSPGGAIIGYEIINETEYDYDYLIDVLVSDPASVYASYLLYYGYAYSEDETITYQTEMITDFRSSVIFEGVSAYNVRVHLILVGVTSLGEEVILDEVSYHVPFKLESSIYLDRIGMQELTYSFYPDTYALADVAYAFNIYRNQQKVQSIEVVPIISNSHFGSQEVVIEKLKSNTTYLVEVTATYINPYTLRSETVTVFKETVTTLPSFTATIDITEFETYYEVNIFVIDPSHLFQIPYFALFDLGGEHPMYINGQDFSFTPEANGKRVIFTIDKPVQETYQLIIGIRNTTNYNIRHIMFDEDISK